MRLHASGMELSLMAPGLQPALEQGEGRGSVAYGGCCGALLLIRVPSPRLEFMRSIRGSWVCLGYSQVCTCVSVPCTYGCMRSVSAPGPAYGEAFFWEVQMVPGEQNAGWCPAAPLFWELCAHLILCQPGLSPGAEKCPKSQNVPGTGKAFPTLL